MKNDEIFTNVLKKAEEGGFKINSPTCFLLEKEPYLEGCNWLKYKNLVQVQVDNITCTYIGLESIIFSHDFAKAFFGEERNITDCVNSCNKMSSCDNCGGWILEWKFQLSRMVLEPEPLKYLEKFL